MQDNKILKVNQPGVDKKLHKRKRRKRKPKERKEHLSFNAIDRLMRERSDVDESKCR